MVGNHRTDVETAAEHCHHLVPGLEHFAAINSFQTKALKNRLVQVHLGYIRVYAKQRYLAERIQELTTKDVEQRFFTFLRSQYGEKEAIHTPLSKKDIAAAIGTTPESLSRLILRLTEDQIIDWQGKEIKILANPWRWLD